MVNVVTAPLRGQRVRIGALIFASGQRVMTRRTSGSRRKLPDVSRLPSRMRRCIAPRGTQALDNLLSNAVKFTPADGVMTLDALVDEQDVCMVVRDTGQGLTVEQQANLFTRFWQARRGDRRGVGLGLTIVKGIVDAHGGTIAAESQPGRGSRFRMCIPKSVSEGDAVETQA